MITKAGVNRTKFKVALIANVMCFFGYFLLLQPAMSNESISHSHHDFALSSFNNQVRINFGKKSIQSSSSDLGTIASTIDFRLSSQSFLLNIGRSSFFMNPIYETSLIIRDFDVGMVIEKSLGRFGSKETNEKATFSIDDSCKIGKFCFSHKTPLLMTVQYATNPLFVQRERLNSLAPKGDAIV